MKKGFLAMMAAGGAASLRAPGEAVETRLKQPACVWIWHPPQEATRAAQHGCEQEVQVSLRQMVGAPWAARAQRRLGLGVLWQA